MNQDEILVYVGFIVAVFTTFLSFGIHTYNKTIRDGISNEAARKKLYEVLRRMSDESGYRPFTRFFLILDAFDDVLASTLLKFLIRIGKRTKASENSKAPQISIVSLLALKQSKTNVVSSAIIMAALVLYLSVNYFFGFDQEIEVVILLSTLPVILFVDELILSYRIKRGHFGTNSFEAKEVIKFIVANSEEHENFKGPDGKMPIFDTPSLDTLRTEEGFNTGLNPSF